MSAISLKSITGITSITTPAGVDNQLTLHTNNTTERLRIDSSGRLLIGTTTEGHGNADDLTIATTDHTGITLRSATNRNGSVFFSDGTSGADEYRGWIQYTHTSDYLTFGTAANERVRITSGGLVGIGTIPASGTTLDIDASGGGVLALRRNSVNTNNKISLSHDGTNGTLDSTNAVLFRAGGSERLRISSDGTLTKYLNGSTVQVAFGGSGQINGITALPSMAGSPLVVGRDTGTTRSAHFGGHLQFDSGYGIQGTEFSVYGNTNGLYLNSNVSGDAIIFQTHNGSSVGERLRIASDGSLTSTANNNGQIIHTFKNDDTTAGSSAQTVEHWFRFNRTGGGMNHPAAKIVAGKEREWVGGASNQDGYLAFYTTQNENGGAERLRITSEGKIGIGRQDPVNFIDIARGQDEENIVVIRGADNTTEYGGLGISGGNYVITGGGSGSTSTGIVFRTAASGTETERLRIASNGDVGVGNDSPDVALHIGGGEVVSPMVKLHRTNTYDNAWRIFQSHYGTGTYGTLFLNPTLSTTPCVEIGNSAGTMAMRVNAHTGVIEVKSGGGINFSATSNSAGTMSSETLDDYEEGSWTPTVSTGNASFSTRSGRYVKIGRQVTIWYRIAGGGSYSGSGSLGIQGLPFTNNTAFNPIGTAEFYKILFANGYSDHVTAYLAGQTMRWLRNASSGGSGNYLTVDLFYSSAAITGVITYETDS